MRWSERTQRVGAMSSMNIPALEQVDQIMNNVPRQVKRTRVRRVDSAMLGGKKTYGEGEEVNLFDDSDFYHHPLRELIEKNEEDSGHHRLGRGGETAAADSEVEIQAQEES